MSPCPVSRGGSGSTPIFAAVCEFGYEGVVAKNHASTYGLGERGWVKVKNPFYWRRDAELKEMARRHERSLRPDI